VSNDAARYVAHASRNLRILAVKLEGGETLAPFESWEF
jgi:hypothetical protein